MPQRRAFTMAYAQVAKSIVASAVDAEGEQLFPRKWNQEFIDLPIVDEEDQNTPSFDAKVMSGLARWQHRNEQMLFILCGATGERIGEALGIEIDKHISPDFLTINIKQKVRHCKMEAGGPGTDCSSSRPASRIQSVPRSSRSCDERAAGGPDLGKNFIQVGMHAAPRPSGRRDREEYFPRFIEPRPLRPLVSALF